MPSYGKAVRARTPERVQVTAVAADGEPPAVRLDARERNFQRAIHADQTEKLEHHRHPWRALTAVVVAALFVFFLYSLATNPRAQWGIIGHYLFDVQILQGLQLTVVLTLVTSVLAFALAFLLVAMRLSRNPVLIAISWFFTWVFRSIPLLVQLLFWFNIGFLYPKIAFSLPFAGVIVDEPSRSLISPVAAAVLGITMFGAAYAGEVIRGGILGVDVGQHEAAAALALPKYLIFWRIIVPQAMRSIVPNAGNLVIEILKGTSLVSVLAVTDLLYSVQLIYNLNYEVFPLLIVASLWYLVITSILAIGQYHVERYYARGSRASLPPHPVTRVWRVIRGRSASTLATVQKGR